MNQHSGSDKLIEMSDFGLQKCWFNNLLTNGPRGPGGPSINMP